MALRLTRAELELRKKQYDVLSGYAAKLEEQRDKAYERADDRSLLPFWAWLVVGVAGGVVLVRGFR